MIIEMDEELKELKICSDHQSNNIKHKTTNANVLLEAVLNNDKADKIQQIIETSTPDLVKHKYEEHGNKTILIVACINENVSKNTLNTLYVAMKSHYYYIDCLDEDWYKWEALHYVARTANPKKLQVLIDNVDNLNSLTTFSENALHVLLEYEESVKPFNTLLYNGTESKECSIISTEKEDTIKCAKILIQAGIDVNHSNFWNETPICIAARYRYREIIKLLLKTPYIDLDNYKEGGTTIREYLKRNSLQDISLQSNFLHEDPVKILFNFLKSRDEESFLNFNNENIKDYVNCIDGDSEHNSCGNMLQLCFKKGFLAYVQHDLYNEELMNGNIMDSPMLSIFCTKGLGRCIEHLLNNGADPKLTYRKFPETLLEAAAVRGYYPLVAILLQHKASKVTANDIFEILPKLFENKYVLNNHEFYRKHVLCLLLNKLIHIKGNEVLISEQLNILTGVLCHLNLESDDEKEDDSENICQILHLGACLSSKMSNNEMLIQRIHSEILAMHFDDCIDNSIFSYNSIIQDNNNIYSETRALNFLANDNKKNKLLRHPLLIHFIHNKWLRIFYFFYIDLLFYLCFLFSIYAYMIFRQYNNKIINTIFYILLGMHTLKECTQLVFLYHLKYFLDASNYLELTVIISCLITIFFQNEYSTVIAILFSTVVFSMFLGELPMFAKYTIIFGSTKYFLEYAGFYFMQFLSFALVFYIIFPFETNETDQSGNSTVPTENFTNETIAGIVKSMFYTLILFTGEFNDRVLEPDRFPVFGRIIMTVFIFCMTIILNNLLVGLIVADMDEMQRDGKLYKQVRTASFVSRMNSLVKRLYEFKTNVGIKNIINFLHIFKKGEHKTLDISDCNHRGVFDEEDRKRLKDIRTKKNAAYDKNTLRSLYALIQKEENETHKKG